MNEPKSTPVVLNLPTIIALLIVFGRHVVQAMTNNPWFASLVAQLATTTADLDALEAAQALALTRAKGTAAMRNLKKKAVVDDLNGLKGSVQLVINQNPLKAAVIAASAGMWEKKVGARWKAILAATMAVTPGEVLVRAKKVPGRGVSYEWQCSSDGGKTWVAMGITTVANTSVLGLTMGTTYQLRFRTTLKKTTGDWCDPISFVVH